MQQPHYNEHRLHFSLDMDSCETPLQAFSARKATDSIGKSGPERTEGDAYDWAK